MAKLLTAVAFSLVITTSLALGPIADVVISNAVIAPDGFRRAASVINGRIDRTIIRANQGDEFQLNVINNLADRKQIQTTSIHWHGFRQRGTNEMDGASMINQCPISKGHSFLYRFTADVAGTYWYHSHQSVQYCDGVRSVIVVSDPNDPHKALYDVDDDSTVFTISDWYHTLALVEDLPNPKPDSVLLNGVGRWKDGPATPLAVVSVQRGKRYRIRLANIGCLANYVFSIDGHTFDIIEVDSINTKPHTVDSIQIFVGQRYSLVLNANKAVNNYWIRAEPNVADVKNTGARRSLDEEDLAARKDAGGFNSAILRYVGAAIRDPTTKEGADNLLREQDLKPLVPNPPPGRPVKGGVDQAFNFRISQSSGRFAINGVSFESPTVPVLLQMLSGAFTAQELMPPGSVYVLNQGNTVELTIPGAGSGGPHPMHLHGHSFHVIRSAGSDTYNYIDPPLRDVVNTGTGGDNVTIRFEVDNPGPWFLHCHIDWHLETGLAVVLAEDPPAAAAANSPPPEWFDLCPIFAAQGPESLP